MTVLERIDTATLPEPFACWFASRGWEPRAHQLELLAKARAGRSVLLIAPTGAGKTLAGFLPSLVELNDLLDGGKSRRQMLTAPSRLVGEGWGRGWPQIQHSQPPPSLSVPPPSQLIDDGNARSAAGHANARRRLISTGRDLCREGGLHTLYISPLKALAVDVARNLERPVTEMGLPIRIETRTGDTPASKRQRQRRDPPHILMTTPEQLALILASPDAPFLFGSLRRVVLDELHALVTSKRGDLLSLGLARLFALVPDLITVGLSATVAEPDDLRRFLVPQPEQGERMADLVLTDGGAAPDVSMLDTAAHLPW